MAGRRGRPAYGHNAVYWIDGYLRRIVPDPARPREIGAVEKHAGRFWPIIEPTYAHLAVGADWEHFGKIGYPNVKLAKSAVERIAVAAGLKVLRHAGVKKSK